MNAVDMLFLHWCQLYFFILRTIHCDDDEEDALLLAMMAETTAAAAARAAMMEEERTMMEYGEQEDRGWGSSLFQPCKAHQKS